MAVLTREEVLSRIDDGEILVIRHGKVLKLNSWIRSHPGGDKAILHMVGRDASDEMDVYHGDDTLKTMSSFSIGEVELPWTNVVPPIRRGNFETADLSAERKQHIRDTLQRERLRDIEKYPTVDETTQLNIHDEFQVLHTKLHKEGYFVCDYWDYAREAARISSLFILSAIFFFIYKKTTSRWMLTISGVCLGFAWHQMVFIAHDSGHLGITHNYYVDSLIGCFLASFVGGLSLGWWKRNHNVHHLVTNDPVHDPDIQHLPFFAVTSKLFTNVFSTFYEKILPMDAVARVMLPIQHHMYYPILCFGRFNLYRLSWIYVLYGQGPKEGKAKYLRHFELLGLSVFFYWFFYLLVGKGISSNMDKFIFVMVSHIATMPVHVQITLSHFAQSTSDLGPVECFPQRQVRTSMDVACPEWLDFVHGGLQFQAIHHLFPRMPRHNLRRAQAPVKEFCDRLGLHYTIYGFASGNKHVLARLADVAKQASVFNECNEFCRQEILSNIQPVETK